MSYLFESYAVGPAVVKNRFVRSATGEGRADEHGIIEDGIIPIYEELAAGGVGMIISGHMGVHAEGRCGPRQTGIWSGKQVPGLRRIAEASKANGTTAVAQINYRARTPAEMDRSEIEEAAEAFVAAAGRACEAGFDGVQIHAAHGFLISGFLTPSENRRTDEYGSGAAGRRRLLMQVVRRSRDAVGSGRLLMCKLGAVDGRDNSLRLEETVETACALAEAGIDGIEVSSTFSGEYGQAAAQDIDGPEKEAYFASLARAIKKETDVPVILVGGLRSLAVMERVVREGACDMVSMSRPFIREPDLVNAFIAGRARCAACISCNKCYDPEGFRCVYR